MMKTTMHSKCNIRHQRNSFAWQLQEEQCKEKCHYSTEEISVYYSCREFLATVSLAATQINLETSAKFNAAASFEINFKEFRYSKIGGSSRSVLSWCSDPKSAREVSRGGSFCPISYLLTLRLFSKGSNEPVMSTWTFRNRLMGTVPKMYVCLWCPPTLCKTCLRRRYGRSLIACYRISAPRWLNILWTAARLFISRRSVVSRILVCYAVLVREKSTWRPLKHQREPSEAQYLLRYRYKDKTDSDEPLLYCKP